MSTVFKILLVLAMLVGAAFPAQARDASFMEPTTAAAPTSEEAIKVDPKADIDVGETNVNVAKHVTVFFVNQSAISVKVDTVTLSNDANITADAAGNDCAKQGTIAPNSRCSVNVTVTPTSPGTWNVDVLMTHDGPGRLARARLSGKTTGTPVAEKKDTGLAVSAQETKPVDFGDITIGDGKTVRSTLMVNDSATPITIYSIDVIEADNGLQRLDQGCAVDMELAPGASCPVTLLWKPKTNGPISTDMIIRHSGRLGFAVIPVRGVAKGDDGVAGNTSKISGKGGDIVPLPPSAKDLEKEMAGKVAPISGEDLTKGFVSSGKLYLIGTIGERALFLKPDEDTVVAAVGDLIDMGNNKMAKLIAISAHSASVMIDGKRKDLQLEAVPSLVAGAQEAARVSASSSSPSSSPPSSSKVSPVSGNVASLKGDVGGIKK